MSTHSIKITEVTLYPIRTRMEGDTLQAFVRIVLNDAFVIKGLRVIAGKFGLFVGFPREKGTHQNICFPIRKDLLEEMSTIILDEYRKYQTTSQHEGEGKVG